jgi:hypothetical protein
MEGQLVRLSYHFWHDPGFGDDPAGDHLPVEVGAVNEHGLTYANSLGLQAYDGSLWRRRDDGQWFRQELDDWKRMAEEEVPSECLDAYSFSMNKHTTVPMVEDPAVDPKVGRQQFMRQWLEDHMQEVFGKTIPKAVEYGSHDLLMMGEEMFALFPQLKGVVSPEELAIAFYIRGKIARLFGAYAQGKLPSDDTWLDTEVYAQMAQYVRQNGRWG